MTEETLGGNEGVVTGLELAPGGVGVSNGLEKVVLGLDESIVLVGPVDHGFLVTVKLYREEVALRKATLLSWVESTRWVSKSGPKSTFAEDEVEFVEV